VGFAIIIIVGIIVVVVFGIVGIDIGVVLVFLLLFL